MAALRVIADGAHAGMENMARDEHLFTADRWRPATLRLYGWDPPTLSLGCFQKFERIAELPDEVRALDVVRRPTGGGAILHDRELTYCLVLDDSIALAGQAPVALYRLVHELWRDVLGESGVGTELAPDSFPMPSPRTGPFFCFEKPGKTDLIIGNAKLLGSAQRRVGGRVLQHGSLLLGRRFAAHPGVDLGEPDTQSVQAWCDAFVFRLADALGVVAESATWSDADYAPIAALRERHASHAWLHKH